MQNINAVSPNEAVDAVQPVAEQSTSPTEKTQEADKPSSPISMNDYAKHAANKELGSQFTTGNQGYIGTQTVINILENKGDISMVKKMLDDEAVSDDDPYKLYERQGCLEFVKKYKVSKHLAYAIAASIYEYVPISDLPFLSQSLLQCFDALPYREKEYDKNGNEVFPHRSELIPLDDISNIIGTIPVEITFTTRFETITERCFGYEEEARGKVRNNLWSAFPGIRGVITSWLLQTDFSHSYRNALSTSCLVSAIYNIIKMDFGDAMNTLFPALMANEKNKPLLMRVMLLLNKNEETTKNADALLKQWASSYKWLWEIPIVVYGQAEEDVSFAKELEHTIAIKLASDYEDGFGGWSTYFIAWQMKDSLRLRNLVSQTLSKLITDADSPNSYAMAANYLVLVSNVYQFVDKNHLALPLVANDNEAQLEGVRPFLYKIFSDYDLRHWLFEVLGAYLSEINSYNLATIKLLNQLKGFFYIIATKSERFNGDVQRFLLRLQSRNNNIAKQILTFLQEKIPSNKGLPKHDQTNHK